MMICWIIDKKGDDAGHNGCMDDGFFNSTMYILWSLEYKVSEVSFTVVFLRAIFQYFHLLCCQAVLMGGTFLQKRWRFFDKTTVDALPPISYLLPAVIGDFPTPNPPWFLLKISLDFHLPRLLLVGHLVTPRLLLRDGRCLHRSSFRWG